MITIPVTCLNALTKCTYSIHTLSSLGKQRRTEHEGKSCSCLTSVHLPAVREWRYNLHKSWLCGGRGQDWGRITGRWLSVPQTKIVGCLRVESVLCMCVCVHDEMCACVCHECVDMWMCVCVCVYVCTCSVGSGGSFGGGCSGWFRTCVSSMGWEGRLCPSGINPASFSTASEVGWVRGK